MSEGKCKDCGGDLKIRPTENCSCHISPPCSGCVDAPLYCANCGFEEKIERMNGYRCVVKSDGTFESFRPRTLDKTKIDYRIESHTHFSQKCVGVYPEGTERSQVEALVRGTFGGRFERFANGEFEYVAYTD